MKPISKYLVLVLVVMLLNIAGESSQALADDAPKLSSSLAKNLWRQAHFYFEEGMDAKAIRACKELQAWARENNEPAVEKKMSDMLKVLHERQQTQTAPKPKPKKPASPKPQMQTHLPACGYGSVKDMPTNIVYKIITRTPEEFLACQQDQDCVAAYNFCGTSRALNKTSQQCYEAVARHFETLTSCLPVDPFNASAVCRNQSCTLHFQ